MEEGSATQNRPSNPFELAGKIGHDFCGSFGKTVFEEFELAFASQMSARFEGFKDFRVAQNLNLYWDKGYYKSLFCDKFRECLPKGCSIKVTSATQETMFGSINQTGTRLNEPLFYRKDFCFMPELLSFLQTGESFRNKVSDFNEVLERGEVTKTLLKFSSASQELIDKYKNGLDGLYFDGKTLRYYPDTCFIVGTHPVESTTFAILDTYGFWSRFHTIQARITDGMARDFATGSMKSFNETDIAELLRMNQDIHKSKLVPAEMPNEHLLQPVWNQADKYVEATMEKSKWMSYKEIFTQRIKGDVIREINAYRILCPGVSDETVEKWAYHRLTHFFDFVVSPIIAPSVVVVRQKTIDSCMKDVLALIKEKPKKREEIQETMQQQGYSRPMIDRVLELIKTQGQNKSKEYGVYEA